MKFRRSTTWGVFIALTVFGIGFFFFRPPAVPVSAPAAKGVTLATNSPSKTSVEVTNPPALSTAKSPNRDNRRLTPLKVMKETLDLSDEQTTKLEPILQEQQKQLSAFRRETSLSRQQRIARLKEMQETNDVQLKSVLTPEQFEKWRTRGLNFQQSVQQHPQPLTGSNPPPNAASHELSRSP